LAVRLIRAGDLRGVICVESGTSTLLTAVWGSSPNDVWAGGENFTLLRRVN